MRSRCCCATFVVVRTFEDQLAARARTYKQAGDAAGVRKLLDAGADAAYSDRTGNSLLHLVLRAGADRALAFTTERGLLRRVGRHVQPARPGGDAGGKGRGSVREEPMYGVVVAAMPCPGAEIRR